MINNRWITWMEKKKKKSLIHLAKEHFVVLLRVTSKWIEGRRDSLISSLVARLVVMGISIRTNKLTLLPKCFRNRIPFNSCFSYKKVEACSQNIFLMTTPPKVFLLGGFPLYNEMPQQWEFFVQLDKVKVGIKNIAWGEWLRHQAMAMVDSIRM